MIYVFITFETDAGETMYTYRRLVENDKAHFLDAMSDAFDLRTKLQNDADREKTGVNYVITTSAAELIDFNDVYHAMPF